MTWADHGRLAVLFCTVLPLALAQSVHAATLRQDVENCMIDCELDDSNQPAAPGKLYPFLPSATTPDFSVGDNVPVRKDGPAYDAPTFLPTTTPNQPSSDRTFQPLGGDSPFLLPVD